MCESEPFVGHRPRPNQFVHGLARMVKCECALNHVMGVFCFSFATPGDVAMIGKAVSGDHSQLATVQCLNPNDKPRLTFFLKTLQKQQNSQFWHQEASSCDVLFLPLLKILYWEMPKESYNVGWMGRLCFSDVSMYHCRVFLFSEDCLVSGKNKSLFWRSPCLQNIVNDVYFFIWCHNVNCFECNDVFHSK